ncbi:hypothetical protein FB451DRAFT_1140148 [Mycena latifolia]|nr:hypothetical protein FB451DRAFT_1140148 [Mycena latifolia]
MAELALINIDKCEVVDPSETGHGYKMKEAIANWMTMDILWLFAVPADDQTAPEATTAPSGKPFSHYEVARARVPIGHWAGDRVVIVDEYRGTAQDNLPADLLAKFPAADPEEDVLEYALAHLKHVGLAEYKPGGEDALFPVDRVWVVRNLTKRWYARADVLVKAKYRRGPAVERGVGLSDLIWAEIGGAMNGAGSVGDRFDIQTLAALEDGKEWTNRSGEAKLVLRDFNESEVEELRGDYDYDY